jgi:hypothetical protein
MTTAQEQQSAAPLSDDSNIPWHQRRYVIMDVGPQTNGLSRASHYRAAAEGKLKLVRLGGRTLIDVPSLIAFNNSAEQWTPSKRGAAARAARSDRAKARWQP